MVKEQKLIRVHGYKQVLEEDSIKELNKYLSNGWKVVLVTNLTTVEGFVFSDYIIETLGGHNEKD